MRRSLDLTSWEAAARKIRELEIHGEKNSISVKEACEKFRADCLARKLSPATIKKYKYILAELEGKFGDSPVRSISIDDLREMRQCWKFAGSTARKRVEYLRAFFAFCVSSGWIAVNPAKGLKPPKFSVAPTLPYNESDWKSILSALDEYGDKHPQTLDETVLQLKALVLVMRYSGLRISDAVSLKRERIDAKGRLFLYQAKTGQPVQVPLPPQVIQVLGQCDTETPFYFWNGGKLQTALSKWQARLKKVFEIAKLPEGHSHRFRDSFAVDLLTKGVPLHTVSVLLGHTSVKTTEKHYAPFVQASQDALELAVKKTWI